mgnify:CR=1 FL=1
MKERKNKMGSLKNILLQCEEYERQCLEMDITSRDRDINKGWIECCEFFFRNFDMTEKTINKERD